jgi:predicted lipid-binding transport protein (Tim44 family)
MNFWLVCFLIFFFGAEGLQWLGQLSWLSSVDLFHPLVIVAGLGLAIASNSMPSVRALKPSSPQPTTKAADATHASLPNATPTLVTAKPTHPSRPSSISFEIRKPRAETGSERGKEEF